jgi:phenylpropionate dioxygenase-like ring-hydroxylating dioxygenase large terminal subunit
MSQSCSIAPKAGSLSRFLDAVRIEDFLWAKSRVIGEDVQCSYHGLIFRPDGSCTSQNAIPVACRIKSYSIVEKWKWIWIWMGDTAKADHSLIPHWSDGSLASTW